MSRIMQALISGLMLGFGVGSVLAEMWITSAVCFVGTAVGLFLFIRSCLRRVF